MPSFTWNAVKNAAQYEFQLAADRAFASIVLGTGPGRGSFRTKNTAATLKTTVPDGTYFWRVRAITPKDRAGAWSSPRIFRKAWTTAPVLEGPANDFDISWPSSPLVLRWSSVPHAAKYIVSVATDPSLAQNLLGTNPAVQETEGNVAAFPGTLPSGRYYWAVTPVDAGGQRGTRSIVGSFTWSWPTTTTPRVIGLTATSQVFDPLLNWDPVPGAARYEVEVNPSADFAPGSRVCCTDKVIGTSQSPLKLLPNNRYFWRVRAIDADTNVGVWNAGPEFVKAFDDLTPTIPNLHLRDHAGNNTFGTATGEPIVSWDPVAGAAEYEVQTAPLQGGICDWTTGVVPLANPGRYSVRTSNTSWAPLAPNRPAGTPAPGGPVPDSQNSIVPFADGVAYCVRVLALSDKDQAGAEIASRTTQLGAANQSAFTYVQPAGPGSATQLTIAASQYREPVQGSVTPRQPLFTWDPVAGAVRYFVVVARDPSFTNVVEVGFTDMPAFAPKRVTFSDETTSYYWAVYPSGQASGAGVNTDPNAQNFRSFDKRSVPPTLLMPIGGVDAPVQPTFQWTSAEGARNYRIQVSTDPDFGALLDDVVTASTAYTGSTTYPADTVLYWRVRANDGKNIGLNFSAPATFRRRLAAPIPAADNPLGGDLIPLWSWAPVPGAVAYDVHVDQADGKPKDFTVKSSAFTAGIFQGTGIFRYKARAKFATGAGSVTGPYFDAQQFTRSINPPSGARLSRTRTQAVFSWNASAGAKSYVVEVSKSNAFGAILDTVRTDNTSWAPDLTKPEYGKGVPLFWRIASIDSGGNIGAYATGQLNVGKALSVVVHGRVKRGATSRLVVSVRYKGKAIRSASVRVSGAGVRAQGKRTSKRGSTSFKLRAKKRGSVVLTVSRGGYTTKRVTLSVK